MPSVKKRYRTAPRPKGARSGGIDPRGGEDRKRGGQKTYQDDVDDIRATEKRGPRDKGPMKKPQF